MKISVRVTGGGSLRDRFALMQERVANLHPAFTQAAIEVLDAAKEEINEQGNPPWVPKKHPNGHPLLEKTGALKSSLSAASAVTDIPQGVKAGTNLFYARYQQEGTRSYDRGSPLSTREGPRRYAHGGIPARPFLWAKADRDSLTARIRDIFARRIMGA